MTNHLSKNGIPENGGATPPVSAKSYLAKTVDEAIAQAREELGCEAMLLNTRKFVNEQGLPGGYEVVFGVPEPELERQPSPAPPPHAAAEDLAADLERLHAQMDEIRNLLMRPNKAQYTPVRTAPELADVYDCLISSEVEPALSKDIVDRLEADTSVDAYLERTAARRGKSVDRGPASLKDGDTLKAFVLAELERRVAIAPRLGQNGVVLVGPPGAGKTTTVAKLASLISDMAETRPVRVLSLDTSARGERLREMAEKLGIALTNVPAIRLLPSLIAEARNTEFLLIDTPGYASSDRNAATEAAAALTGRPGIDTHLVVPGYMKPADLRRCIQNYAIFQPSKLLVTKLDETHSFGSVFSQAARAGLALSFLAHGPAIPRDIRAASPQDLLGLALQRAPEAAANVA
jgi:flagellar biosynthesis protein FlhF